MDSSEYRILGPIGSGGTSEILEASASNGAKVAVKRYAERLAGPELLDRFLADAHAQVSLVHPGIVRVFDYGVSEGRPFLILELIEGLDLAALEDGAGKAGATIPAQVILAILARAAEALDYAHHALDGAGELREILHGDVSPENILISWTGETKLTDFGVAIDGGKHAYLAPERAQGAPPSKAADVYALGATLKTLLADEVPETLAPLLERMLSAGAEQRPSAGACAAELHRLLQRGGDTDERALVRGWMAILRARSETKPAEHKVNLFAVPQLITGSLASAASARKQHSTIQVHPARASVSTEAGSLIGAVLHGFRIEEAIASRGSASVYRARHKLFARDYAVKVLHAELLDEPEVIEHFQREAVLLSKLDHPHVVRATDFGVTPAGAPFIAMELVPGVTLEALLEARGPLPPARARSIARQIALALHAAHGIGLVHRDVKPSNVMVLETPRGDQVKLIDFGIAQVSHDARDRLTETGLLIGTPAYMAPEQIVGARMIAPAADLYALGCVLHFMLTGGAPFGENALVAMEGHLYREPPSLPPSDGLDRLARRLLAKRADDRLQNAASVIAALDRRSKAGARVLAGASIASALAVGVYLAFWSGAEPAPGPVRGLETTRPTAVQRAEEAPMIEPPPAEPEPPKKTRAARPMLTPTRVEDPPPAQVIEARTATVVELADLRRAIAALPSKIARLDPRAQVELDRRYLDLRSAIKSTLKDGERRALAEAIADLDRAIDAHPKN